MLHEFRRALNHGKLIKTQSFVTDKGVYRMDFLRFEDDIYLAKYKGDQIVECCNLSKMKAR